MQELLQLKRMQGEPIMTNDGELIEEAPVDMARGTALAEAVLRSLGETPDHAPPEQPAVHRLAALEHALARPIERTPQSVPDLPPLF
jgi:hypothetical protein